MSTAEKLGLERGAIDNFAAQFNQLVGRGVLAFSKHLDPPMPDALCTLDGSNLYIEIAHLYGTDIDARLLLDRKGRAEVTDDEHLMASMVPLPDRILPSLNRILAQKSQNSYPVTPTWLLIRNAFVLWRSEDFKLHQHLIEIPPTHTFQEIWLLAGPTAEWGLVHLA